MNLTCTFYPFKFTHSSVLITSISLRNTKQPNFANPCYTINGWPVKHQISKKLFPYYSRHSEITYHEDILFKNQKIIVPTTLHSEIKSIIHQGHFRIENLKKHDCQAMFWPLINGEIEGMIKNYPTCLTFPNQQPSEPRIKHPVPQQPWTKLAADLFRLYGYYYLLIVDYNR